MIKARVSAENLDANLRDYHATCARFSWEDAWAELSRDEAGRINIVADAIDRHAADEAAAGRAALVLDRGGEKTVFTYGQLKELSCRWANLLAESGLEAGDRLFILLPPGPEIYLAMLACARLGVVFSTLYATVSYDDLEVRLNIARPQAVLTHPDLVERLPLEAMRGVDHVFYNAGPLPGIFHGEVAVQGRVETMAAELPPVRLEPGEPLYLLFTSGATGPPKGVVHAHRDMVGHLVTARYALDLGPGSVLWTDGHPAWVTGTVYSAFAPWLAGATSVVQTAPFSASACYRTLEAHGVTNWYTTPNAIRRLVNAGEDLASRYDLSRLRHIACVGEALPPELFYWVKQTLGHPPHNTWWMTETGMICLASFPALDTKPGSIGLPLPGVTAAVVDEEGTELPDLTMGHLALRPDWPALMTGIWGDEERYQAYFRIEGWFLTGDMAVKDEEGYFYYQGRGDDLIKVDEKFIGPYEIESVLTMHPAVGDTAVISRTDPSGRSRVKAFIAPAPGYTASRRLAQEIKAFVKANLSAQVPLEDVQFLEALPRTRSGKLLRRVLRAMDLGLPTEGITPGAGPGR
jgi:acetyl-CoA synthetase